MKATLWLTVLIALALAISMVSGVVAGEERSNSTNDEHIAGAGSISPTAAGPHVRTVIYYVNGVKKPALDFTGTHPYYHVDVERGDTIMMKVIATYTGSGKGYLNFEDVDTGYQESMFLKSGVVSSKKIVRSFMWSTTGSTHVVNIDAYKNGNNYFDPPGDYNDITFHVN